ncbi:DNA-directed RNA polymerase subunit beta' [Candidatus Gottesmanbacteria bacterium RIFCSPHIGHO2_02_FULL_39_14]|uniref:DNA-directed RNA polymerase subunit beta' n=1 Tax=Candidatus Gottesmanbacteria bacterium RIFCSPHIGHO2_02_FULL_39_14 TaxID=1798383 RepID=A0A1F5ZU36_9BACT|nr:MAG: DNA-directed RNA polymerase subunit beta' [Candidatus Gottesmanbacteria bacterium RIFCSPHIGHO2_02_FULL_39_14]
MMDKKGNFGNIVDFEGLQIKLASPHDILTWSYGEVTKPETINYRTLKPEKDGLFDERIFGPTKDWECYCGKYKRIRYRGIVCDKCGVEVTQSKVRRERMGHIKLSAPVAHVWFFKGSPSKLSLIMDITPKALENIIYFASYLVTDIDKTGYKKAQDHLKVYFEKRKEERLNIYQNKVTEVEKQYANQKKDMMKKIKNKETRDLTVQELEFRKKQQLTIHSEEFASEESTAKEIYSTISELVNRLKPLTVISEDEYLKLREYNMSSFFKIGMGAECILDIMKIMNLNKVIIDLRKEAQESAGQRKIKATKRLRVIESLKKAEIDPSWMVISILPVIPPDLRPMVQLTGGKFATSDLNDLYRRVINRNNRLKHLIELGAPEIILRNEKRMLQEAVDSLIDASQRPSGRTAGGQVLRSLSDMLRGKQGRFRQNLLGKRVDYSGRSVIVVGPELKLTQCGLPKEMALELFKPFVLRELIMRGLAPNVKSAKNILEGREAQVFDILEEITKNHPILLNRAPTLHKLGIQAFYPILIEGSAIRIHPCVCAGYNADFDGDQMAVHVPLSQFSQTEAKDLMLPSNNLLKPADGTPITIPNKEMALGCYYLTSLPDIAESIPDDKLPAFSNEKEAIVAYQTRKIILRQVIKVLINNKLIKTSAGRVLFNEILPSELRFFNDSVKIATIKSLITRAFDLYSKEEVATIIDKFKDFGFFGATLAGGVSVSLFDNIIIPEKNKMIRQAEEKVSQVEQNFQQGLITNEERKRLQNEIWIDVTEKLADSTWASMSNDNPVKIIINSGGARASKDQLKQLSAVKGLVVDPLGKIVELPTKSNYREGLSIFEYVTSTRGSRKGLTDSALKTADAGYLTRRLIDVAHDAIIRLDDCSTKKGYKISRSDKRQTSLELRVVGRILVEDVTLPKSKKAILKKGELLTEDKIPSLKDIESLTVRSPLTCELKSGLCANCYGLDLSTKKFVEIGTPVGIIAAQSIGEPGTQLTMRVRHAGGIVGLDVTQGLPRVEELFEARTPKVASPLPEISGKVTVEESEDGFDITIKSVGIKPVEEKSYFVPKTSELRVTSGDLISAGEALTTGPLDIKEVLQIRSLLETQSYLLSEIQKVYESQGIPIHDKHFEVIVRKMSDKVRIETSGDTNLLQGELIDKSTFEEENARILASGGEPATAQVVILGITRASLYTQSWLSSASFQETTSVLTDAALSGREDRLLGLKENVIIGRLIPVTKDRAVINNN